MANYYTNLPNIPIASEGFARPVVVLNPSSASVVTTWSENNALTWTDASPADTVASTADIDLATGQFSLVNIQLSFDWGAAPSDWVDINIYTSQDSGTTIDTIPIYTRRVDAGVNDPEIITIVIGDVPYVRIEVDNQSNDEVTLVGKYSGKS